MADETKELIASSEFNPSNFVRGIDLMTAALEKLSAQEDQIRAELRNIDAALKANRQEYRSTTTDISNLDKGSKTYRDDLQRLTAQKKLLSAQQKELKASFATQEGQFKVIQEAANKYRSSIVNLTIAVKQATDTKGKTFFDTVNLKQQIVDIQAAAGKIQTILKGKVSTAELDKFTASLDDANNEFAEFGKIIAFVKDKLQTLDPDSEEFRELNEIVEKGTIVLDEYNKSLENTDKKAVSLRTRLAALRTALSDLEAQGKENTKEFEDMAVEAGRLQDQMEDTQQRIKILASDTKTLDFGVAAVRGVASAFGIAEGAAALFGLRNEDLQKSLQRLNAIMVILNSLTEIQNLLKKQSVLAVLGETIATRAATAAQRIYAFVVGTSTGAMKGFGIALKASGIGLFLTLIGFAANAMELFGTKTKGTKEELEDFNLALDQSNRRLANTAKDVQFANQIAIEAAKARGETEAQISDRVVKGYQAEAAENKKQADIKIRDVANAVARFTQGAVIIDPNSVKTIDDARKALETVEVVQLRLSRLPGATDTVKEGLTALVDATKDVVATLEAAGEADKKAVEEQFQFRTKRAEDARKDGEKQLEEFRSFLDRLAALQRELRDKELAAKPQDLAAIRERFKNDLSDLVTDIQTEIKRGKLSQVRGDILINFLGKINKVDFDQATKEFQEQVLQFQKEFDQQLFDLQIQDATRRAELIRDQFVREAELLKIESKAEINQLIKDRDAIIKTIEDQPGLVPTVKTAQIEAIKQAYFNLIADIEAETIRRQESIAASIFDKLQDETRTIFANVQLVVSETATAEIQAATEQFTQGKINYKQYQEELTRIATEETNRRIATQLREAQQLLTDVQRQIPTEQDPGRLEQLRAQELELKNRIDALKREEALAEGQEIKRDTDERAKRIQQVAQYAQAIGGIIQQVVGFWQQVNEAEQASLERSIALQERRVEAATKIAERGNSEYLRLEEDRLQELQTKQENAARRQIAINAVLQTSQALTAFISALAQGIALGGPLGGIAIASAVIAAIASGYAIVQSLQPQQGFKEGTKYVKRDGQPAGVDTVPAKLTEGEAVLPVDVNRDYHPAVKAIFDKKIPANVINNFVNNYQNKTVNNPYYEAARAIETNKIPIKTFNEFVTNYHKIKESKETIYSIVNNNRVNQRVLPTVNYEKMSEATQIMISYDGELLQATKEQTRKIDENSELLRRVEYRLKTMGIDVNIDRNGLTIALMKGLEQAKIDRMT